MDNTQTHGKYISWPILTLMAFVTVIGFDDIMYNFKNQGMTVITSWILMLFLYVIPYSLMVGQLGSVFNKEGGGLSSWIRGTNGEFLGYFTAWTYWAASVPYTQSLLALVGHLLVQANSKTPCQMQNLRFGLLLFSLSLSLFNGA